ncbi:hypothetical protein PVAND_002605 [Polypedilum vanderplanki]|uniref:Large ribosomal subunit protein mL50 n=1 Tax=Polypedilum vanderplanki TaxID=319348 RepID=A0A9J6BT32_POLVA|nr:hypothetical protein PVAND_002605 [Polypedilum vanderplanki]
MLRRNLNNFLTISTRFYASSNKIKPFRKVKVHKQIESAAISIKAKGFLRSQKEYDPPIDAKEKIETIAKELNVIDLQEKKFEFLNQCAITFNDHSVPNSRIHEMKTVADVIEYYQTPVTCRTPYEDLDRSVPNLHILDNAKRWSPEDGIPTAYPQSSTLVTGLKYRKKYPGHIAKTSWP